MDEEQSPYASGDSLPESDISSSSSSLGAYSDPSHLPRTDDRSSNFQLRVCNENPNSNSGRYFSVPVAPHDIPSLVPSTISPLDFPTVIQPPCVELPFSSTSNMEIQTIDNTITVAPPLKSRSISSPNDPSISVQKSKVKPSFHCIFCRRNQVIYCANKAVKTIIKHIETHINIHCPICNGSFSMLHLRTHINLCADVMNPKRICPICHRGIRRKLGKHLLSHVPYSTCPFPHCFKELTYSNKTPHFEAHIHEKIPNKYELIPIREKTPRAPNPHKSRSRSRHRREKRVRHFDQPSHPSSEHHYQVNPIIYPIQQCNIQIDLANISRVESTRISEPDTAVSQNPVRPHVPESSTVEGTRRSIVGDWEKHTTGIGSRLMSRMGYIPGQGLGPRGEGILKPPEAVVLPKGANLDRIMCMREAGTLFGKSKQDTTSNEKLLQGKEIDKRIMEKTEKLRALINTIQKHENYLSTLQNIIRDTDKNIPSPSNAINGPGYSLDETIVISDGEQEGKFIGPRSKLALPNVNDYIIISSDDEI